jgi:4a-hydroxytetrahydrobiopterin dehydratase
MQTYTQETALAKLSGLQGWQFENNALVKIFTFDNFRTAMSNMVRISYLCESLNHHPDWTNVYNKLTIRLNTHEKGGVTDKDFELAGKIDRLNL